MRTRWMIGIIGMGAFIYAGYRDDLAAVYVACSFVDHVGPACN